MTAKTMSLSQFSAQLEAMQSTTVPDLIDVENFDFLRSLAQQHAGIVLADHKRRMVHRRVSKRLAALGVDSFSSYSALLQSPAGTEELEHFINALTTNKTEFFRERHHFDHLVASAVPNLLKNRNRDANGRFRVWSAGCSFGPEPYSIAMSLRDGVPEIANWNTKILATDIDTDVLERARKGCYREDDIDAVPPHLRSVYFSKLREDGGIYRIAPIISTMISFNPLNLHGHWPMKGQFDIIFCRNVIIYFDKPTQARLIDRFADIMREDGYLYLGHSESLYRVSDRFRPVGQSIYQKIG